MIYALNGYSTVIKFAFLYKLYINTILKENDKVLHKYLHLTHSFSKNFVKMFNGKNGNTCE